MDEACSTQGRD